MGKPYKKLQRDLLATPALDDLRLKAAAKLPPEQRDGFNIEGLAAADSGLLIGFRHPLVGGKAILVPLDNPAAVIKSKAARFGAPILIDLGGRGIRGIERVGKEYVIAAGPVAASRRMDGRPGARKREGAIDSSRWTSLCSLSTTIRPAIFRAPRMTVPTSIDRIF